MLDQTRKGVVVEFLKEGLKFSGDDSSMNVLLLSMLGAVSEFKRSMIRKRRLTFVPHWPAQHK